MKTVSNTIFPISLWRLAKGDRKVLYAMYRENLPDYVAMESSKNQRGLYFGRLIAFDMDHKTGGQLDYMPAGKVPENGNQLEFIIQHCKPTVRHSMFQASTFDPARDHTTLAQLPSLPPARHLRAGLPGRHLELQCLLCHSKLFAKGYGNFLGLANLGLFMAGEVKLSLARVSCFIGVEKMEKGPKRGHALDALVSVCEEAIGTIAAEESR